MGFVKLTCPSCGAAVELDGSREIGFCSYCGAQIAQEKIVVEHRGSVKVDNSEFVQKSIANGRRALANEDWEEVEKYYNMVEQNAPDNIEAVFFSAYGRAMLSLTDQDYFKRQQKFNVLNNSISVISDHYETTAEDKEYVLRSIDSYIRKMCAVQFVFQRQSIDAAGAIRSLAGVAGTKTWCVNLINNTKTVYINELKEISCAHNDSFLLELLNKWSSAPEANNGIFKTTKVKPSPMSIAGVIFGGLSLGIPFFILSILAIVFSSISLKQCGDEKGPSRNNSIAGLVMGILGIVISFAMLTAWRVF